MGHRLGVTPFYGWGWSGPDIDGPAPFEAELLSLWDDDGGCRGGVARADTPHHVYDQHHIVFSTRHVGLWNLICRPGHYNISIGQMPPLESESGWPRTDKTSAAGFCTITCLDTSHVIRRTRREIIAPSSRDDVEWPSTFAADGGEDWSDDSTESLRDSLRELVLSEVRLASMDHDQVLRLCREVCVRLGCPDDVRDSMVRFATDELDRESSRRAAESTDWPAETDCDRLDRVEEDLRERGIVMRQPSPCCHACAQGEAEQRAYGQFLEDPDVRDCLRGWAAVPGLYLGNQLVEGDSVSLSVFMGWLPQDRESACDPGAYEENRGVIVQEVFDSLRRHGFEPDLDEHDGPRIVVPATWQRRPLSR